MSRCLHGSKCKGKALFWRFLGLKLMALTEFTQNATVMIIPYPARSDNSEGRKKERLTRASKNALAGLGFAQKTCQVCREI